MDCIVREFSFNASQISISTSYKFHYQSLSSFMVTILSGFDLTGRDL